MEVLDNHRGAQLACRPQKLLPTRKAISPTSQEKLCGAAEAEELFEKIGCSGLGFDGANFVRSLDQNLQKPKNHRNEAPQDAIVFSKRQMQDIESVAANLMKELKSMKDIVVETLLVKGTLIPIF